MGSIAQTKAVKAKEDVLVEEDFLTKAVVQDVVIYRLQGQLIDQQSSEPLARYTVHAYDLDAGKEPEELGDDFTDNQGRFELSYTELREKSNRQNNNRKLRLHILDPDGDEIHQTEVQVQLNQEQRIVISVPTDPNISSPTLTEITSKARLNLSSRLIQTLEKQGIRSLADIRKSGGLRHQKDLQLETKDVEQLNAHARLSTLILDVEINQKLISQGFDSPIKIARTSRADFIDKTRQELGEVKATQIHVQALTQKRVLDNILTGVRTDLANGQKNALIEQIEPNLIAKFYPAKCSCKDCESAVSPLAYLADLLDYALTYVKNNGKDIDLEWLYQNFHQPFQKLPVTCNAMEKKIRQVRLAVEVLRDYLGHYSSTSKSTSSSSLLASSNKGLKPSSNASSPNIAGNFSIKAPNSGLSPTNIDEFQLKTPEPEPPIPDPTPGDLGVFLDPSVLLYFTEKNYRLTTYNTLLSQIGTSYDELRLVRVADAENRSSLAERLGIAPEHLNELLIDVTDGAHPTEAELEVLFGLQDTTEPPFPQITGEQITLSAAVPPKMQTWRLQYLRSLWQQQDHPSDSYTEGLLPIVDPDLISQDDLRKPLGKNPAYKLWQQRRADIDAYLQELQTALAQSNGLAALLQARLGKSLTNLEGLLKELQTGQEIEDTIDVILTLGLTIESFTRLMALQAKEQAGTSLEEAEQTEIFAILAQAYKMREKFPVWIEEEQEQDIILGAQHFVISDEKLDPLSQWLSPSATRQEWQEVLHQNSQPAIIVPYVIDADYFESENSKAHQIWQARQKWVNQLKQQLKTEPKGKRIDLLPQTSSKSPTTQGSKNKPSTANSVNLLKLEIILDNSNLDISLRNLESLTKKRAKGEDITPKLEQLNLTNAAFTYLTWIRDMVAADAPILNSEWEEVYAILMRVAMQRQFTQWRQEERAAGITLSPDDFVIPEVSEAPKSLPKWLTTWQERRNWEDKLQARIDQEAVIIQALQDAVSATEAATLPMLRDALIQGTNAKGSTLAAKAKWLSDRLLIDFQTSGCQVTTRVSQAIETLQSVIWSVRTGQLQDTYPKVKLTKTSKFEEEWKWLGSYANWRAAMFVFLYPENILIPTLRKRQTPDFCDLVETIRTKQPLTPAEVQDAANQYENYFRDVCNLEIQASCRVQSRLHVFGLVETNGKVYATNFKEELAFWHPVTVLTNVLQIIGAIPYQVPSGTRFIYLFVKSREAPKNKLVYTRLNLESLEWDEPIELQLPPGAEIDFSAVLSQSPHGTAGDFQVGAAVQPLVSDIETNLIVLVVQVPSGRIDIRWFNREGTGWANEQWTPLFGTSGVDYELCTLIQRSRNTNEYVLIVRQSSGLLQYRTFWPWNPAESKDDGYWRAIATGKFAGALVWPGTEDIFVFNWTGESTDYQKISKTIDFNPIGYVAWTLQDLDGWLIATAGVSLKTYFYVDVSLKKENVLFLESAAAAYTLIDVEFPYKGNLYDLLTLTEGDMISIMKKALNVDEIFPTVAGGDLDKYTFQEWIRLLQQEGLNYLESRINQSQNFHDALEEWTLADRYIRYFSFFDGIGLTTALEHILDAGGFAWVTFRFRGFLSESTRVGKIKSKEWMISSLASDKSPIGSQHEMSVPLKYNEKFSSITLKRSGDKLSYSGDDRLIPYCKDFNDITAWNSTLNLLERKKDIQAAFLENDEVPLSVLTYLEEAFYSVPIYLALQLQKSHYYGAALDWFRTVYDYSAPLKNRKIYTGPIFRSSSNPVNFERAEDWLLDPLNPHAIALMRGYHSVYSRFTLISLIRCFLDYADAEFSRDTVESVARARTLYTTASELLDSPELKQELSWCQDLIGSIEFEVGPEKLRSKTQQELSKINDPKRLDVAIAGVKKILKEDGNEDEKFSKIKTLVREFEAQDSQPKTLAAIVQTKPDQLSEAYTHLLADSRVTTAIAKVSKNKGNAFLQNISHRSRTAKEIREPEDRERSPRRDELAQQSLIPLPSPQSFKPSQQIGEIDAFKQSTLEDEPPIPPSDSGPFVPYDGTKPDVLDVGYADYEYAPELSIDFCIPPNPVLRALRQRAELALYKIRNCLNIAGMRRELAPYAAPTDTVSGLPLVSAGDQLVLPGANLTPAVVALRPTLYRYSVIIERAKQLVQLATQIESAMLSAIEKRDNEAYTLLKAQQDADMARAGVRLQDLRLQEAASGVILAQFQQARAQIQVDHFAGLLSEGNLQQEEDALKLMEQSIVFQGIAAAHHFAAAAFSQTAAAGSGWKFWALENMFANQASALSSMAAASSTIAGIQSTQASILSTKASYERRKQDWELQKSLSEQDVLIGAQQVQIAQQHTFVVRYERAIAEMQVTHAEETIDFLTNKFTNVALYDWMSGVLKGVYSYFLQQATSMAKLAETQLSFERQEIAPAFIQSDYWDAPGSAAASSNGSDRRGLTGSARLQQDIYQLDQYAFETNQRKLQLTKTISLARLAPIEFQRLRETGVMIFATPMKLFDYGCPGHYLRLIHCVRTSVIALIPPTQGIHATLSTTGTSRVVIGGDIFQTTIISRGPESVALSAPFNETGVFELQQQPEMLLPFEGIGVDTTWEFLMSKASNFFDYSTIADVLITIEYTALNSYDYRQQVIQQLDNRISGDRPFSFRNELADQWYDLNNPDQTATPMVVRFQTQREDLPPNIQDLKIQHVVLYFVRKDGADFEIPVTHLHFIERNSIGTVGGGAQSIDGIISTRRGNAASWTAMIGKSPFGTWELSLDTELKDGQLPSELLENEEIKDILFVITYSGRTPNWPV